MEILLIEFLHYTQVLKVVGHQQRKSTKVLLWHMPSCHASYVQSNESCCDGVWENRLYGKRGHHLRVFHEIILLLGYTSYIMTAYNLSIIM